LPFVQHLIDRFTRAREPVIFPNGTFIRQLYLKLDTGIY